MKKNQVAEILVSQTKRRNKVLSFLCLIVIVFVLSLAFMFAYINKSKVQYVNYDEKSDIDYKVILKDNYFFEEDYLGVNKKYIASLIDHITADFNYNLAIENENVEYKYSYRIESVIDVREKDSDFSLFNKKEILLNTKYSHSYSNEFSINEQLMIDYNKYNDLIESFVSVYDLDNTVNTLTINMYINILGTCEDFAENQEKESVISLTIPLTTKTVGIDIVNNLVNTENNIMLCNQNKNNFISFLIIAIMFFLIDIILIVYIIRYEISTRTAENIYEKELKKILNNYSSYIQILNDDFELGSYQLLKVNTFTDMLEIRDTIRQPILFKENPDKKGAYFLIPSNTKVLYIYRLKVNDIETKIKENS